MIEVRAEPGRITVRSRTLPTWAMVLLAIVHVPLLAILWAALLRIPQVVALECDGGSGRCVRSIDGAPAGEIALADVARVDVRVARGGRRSRSASLALATRSGERFSVTRGERTDLVRRDAATLERFLAAPGRERVRLEWDHRGVLLAAGVGMPAVMLLAFLLVTRPTVCTVDRLARTVEVRGLRRRRARLDAFTAVRVQTGAENVAERRRLHRERTGREPGMFAPRASAAHASARRIVLVARDGSSFPVTAWVTPREDPAPAAARLRDSLALASAS